MKKSNFLPIFIVHWNQPEACLETIESLRAQDIPSKITVLDNGSSYANFSKLEKNIPQQIHLIRSEKNLGWGPGFNYLLIDHLAGDDPAEFFLICSHDTLFIKNCLFDLVSVISADPKIGIACPQYDGSASIPIFSPIRGFYAKSLGMPSINETIDLTVANGTCMIFRTNCLREIGLFDERFFAYGDEYDLSQRALKKCWKVVLVPKSKMINKQPGVSSFLVVYLNTRNFLLLSRIYGGYFAVIIRIFFVLLGTMKSCFLYQKDRKSIMMNPAARLLGVRDFLMSRFGKPFFLE